MIRKTVSASLCALSIALGAFGQTANSTRPASSPQPDWPAVLRLGTIPTEGGNESKERFMGLSKHLQKQLGIPVELVSASDYAGVITGMEYKHIDLAILGPQSYVKANEKTGATALVMEVDVNGHPGYTPIFITRKGSGIATLEQAKGKSFCFTDPNSTSGYLAPSVVFSRDLKIAPESYFSSVSFSGSHSASVLAVKNGKIDVAAVSDIELARVIESGAVQSGELSVIYKAASLPGVPLALRKGLPETLRQSLLEALLTVKDDPELAKKLCISGYKAATDQDYDIIRYLEKAKSLNAQQKQPR